MKIAFVAMSGIRVCDAELLRLGLTLPGFVERSKVIASLPSLGLLTLAGMTPEHHELHYLEMPEIPADRESICCDFDLVTISSFTAQMPEAYELARFYREHGVPVVLGGLHATALPEEAKQHCDAVVIGEGESCWADVVSDAERGSLKPFYGSRAGDFDLASAPIPAYHLLDISRYNRLTVQTSRGCPHRCDFCASSVLISPKYKQKPAQNVLAEIDAIRALWDHPFVEFADDNTFVDKRYWKSLLPPLKERKVRWFTETDISVAGDSELLTLMRDAGCAQILVGLESPGEAGLGGLELTTDWKRKQWQRYRESIREIQSHGISVNGCFIIGLDAHGPEIFDEVLRFVDESGLHEVQVTIRTPFPGTPLYERMEREGRLLDPGAWNRCTLFDVTFRPEKMTLDELNQGFRKLVVDLYSEERTRRRRENFRNLLRHGRHAAGKEGTV